MKRLRIGRARGRWKNWSWEPNDADRRLMSDLLYKGDRAISDGARRRKCCFASGAEDRVTSR